MEIGCRCKAEMEALPIVLHAPKCKPLRLIQCLKHRSALLRGHNRAEVHSSETLKARSKSLLRRLCRSGSQGLQPTTPPALFPFSGQGLP